jgi:hypothetical protein
LCQKETLAIPKAAHHESGTTAIEYGFFWHDSDGGSDLISENRERRGWRVPEARGCHQSAEWIRASRANPGARAITNPVRFSRQNPLTPGQIAKAKRMARE